MLWKLKQRPTMASFPPWAASEQGLHGRPLGAPVISCAGCGAPGQPQWAGSRAGHLLPTRQAGPQARGAASVSRASAARLPRHTPLRACLAEACPAPICLGFLDGKPDPVPAALSLMQTPRAPPSAREAVCLPPHHSPQPLWLACWPYRTEDKVGQGALGWLLLNSSGIVLEGSLGLVLGLGLSVRFSIKVKVKREVYHPSTPKRQESCMRLKPTDLCFNPGFIAFSFIT